MEIINEAIQIGTLVRLKSGGPDMTVTGRVKKNPKILICTWWDESIGQKSDTFHEDAVRIITPEVS